MMLLFDSQRNVPNDGKPHIFDQTMTPLSYWYHFKLNHAIRCDSVSHDSMIQIMNIFQKTNIVDIIRDYTTWDDATLDCESCRTTECFVPNCKICDGGGVLVKYALAINDEICGMCGRDYETAVLPTMVPGGVFPHNLKESLKSMKAKLPINVIRPAGSRVQLCMRYIDLGSPRSPCSWVSGTVPQGNEKWLGYATTGKTEFANK